MLRRRRRVIPFAFAGMCLLLALGACVGDDPESFRGDVDAAGTDGAPSSNAESGTGSSDAVSGSDGAPNGPCDLGSPWSDPALVPGLEGPGLTDPTLTDDELTIVFTYSLGLQIAGRAATTEAFVNQKGIPNLHNPRVNPTTPNEDDQKYNFHLSPFISPNGLTILFSANWFNVDDIDIMRSSRSSVTTDFPAPSRVTASSAAYDDEPFLTANEKELWFSSARSGSSALYKSTLIGQDFQNVESWEKNESFPNTSPVLSADGRMLYFASIRPEADAGLEQRIWMSSRASVGDPWSAPVQVKELASSTDPSSSDRPSWLSPDGCRIYFTSTRGADNSHHIYVARHAR